jgi:hypothetical protein
MPIPTRTYAAVKISSQGSESVSFGLRMLDAVKVATAR